MRRLTFDDVKKIVAILPVPLDDSQIKEVEITLSQTLDVLQPLARKVLSKEVEPTTYLARISSFPRARVQ
jgi:hypothetical protein